MRKLIIVKYLLSTNRIKMYDTLENVSKIIPFGPKEYDIGESAINYICDLNKINHEDVEKLKSNSFEEAYLVVETNIKIKGE